MKDEISLLKIHITNNCELYNSCHKIKVIFVINTKRNIA